MIASYEDENGVPRNRLGILDGQALHRQEYLLTRARAKQLLAKPIVGTFDLGHLKAIHGHLFQDVYDWAGKMRTMNFSKRSETHPGWKGVFAPVDQIDRLAAKVHEFTSSRDNLRGLDKERFVDAITQVYASWNYIHPFPEGNGRSTQQFIAQLARAAGHSIDYTRVTKDRWNAAAAASMPKTHMREPGMTMPADIAQMHSVFMTIVDAERTRVVKPNERER